MATTSGTVTYIYVNEFWGCVDLSGSFMLLWSDASPTAAERIMYNQWLALARDAFANGNTLVITHDTGSSLATAVQIE